MTRKDLLAVLRQWERSMPSPKITRENMRCCGGSMSHAKGCKLLAAIRWAESSEPLEEAHGGDDAL